MPLYEYVCPECKERYTIIAMKPAPKKYCRCTKCGNLKAKLVPSLSNFRVIGPGPRGNVG